MSQKFFLRLLSGDELIVHSYDGDFRRLLDDLGFASRLSFHYDFKDWVPGDDSRDGHWSEEKTRPISIACSAIATVEELDGDHKPTDK
jgi:hypothetical protein